MAGRDATALWVYGYALSICGAIDDHHLLLCPHSRQSSQRHDRAKRPILSEPHEFATSQRHREVSAVFDYMTMQIVHGICRLTMITSNDDFYSQKLQKEASQFYSYHDGGRLLTLMAAVDCSQLGARLQDGARICASATIFVFSACQFDRHVNGGRQSSSLLLADSQAEARQTQRHFEHVRSARVVRVARPFDAQRRQLVPLRRLNALWIFTVSRRID